MTELVLLMVLSLDQLLAIGLFLLEKWLDFLWLIYMSYIDDLNHYDIEIHHFLLVDLIHLVLIQSNSYTDSYHHTLMLVFPM